MPRNERIERLYTRCPCCGIRTIQRSPAASRNELTTAIMAAEDVIDPHAAPLVVLGQGDNASTITGREVMGWFTNKKGGK